MGDGGAGVKKSSVIIVVLTLLGTGWLVSRTNDAAPPDLAAGAKPGEAMAQVVVPALEGDAAAGAVLFTENCAVCHGANAAGQQGVAPPLVHKVYRNRSHADYSFVLAVQNGVRAHHWGFGNMPKIEGLTQDEVLLIAAYVRALQEANGIE